MNKLDIGGRMRSLLGGLVVVDDVIEVLFFSVMCQVALQLQGGTDVHAIEVLGHVARELGLALLLELLLRGALPGREGLPDRGGGAQARRAPAPREAAGRPDLDRRRPSR